MAKKIIIGNWKMNPLTLKEAEKLFSGVAKNISGVKKTEVVICAPFIYLEKLTKIRTGKIKLGAQDAFWGDVGAHTGKVSAEMLYEIGARYAILGHSERRALGESDSDINKKIKAALSAGLFPILCVGENERDSNHEYFNLVKNQLEECVSGISKDLMHKIIIAYEPVWAISTTANRHDATSADCREMAIFIRKIIFDKLGGKIKMPRVIYGGSVNERDAGDFIANGSVDGLLVGKSSLDIKKFSEIVKLCEALSN